MCNSIITSRYHHTKPSPNCTLIPRNHHQNKQVFTPQYHLLTLSSRYTISQHSSSSISATELDQCEKHIRLKAVKFRMKHKNQFIIICVITIPMLLLSFLLVLTIYWTTTGSQFFINLLPNLIFATIFQDIYYCLHVVDEETVTYIAGKLQIQCLN